MRQRFYTAPKPFVLVFGLLTLTAMFAFAFSTAGIKIRNEVRQVELSDDYLMKLFWDDPPAPIAEASSENV